MILLSNWTKAVALYSNQYRELCEGLAGELPVIPMGDNILLGFLLCTHFSFFRHSLIEGQDQDQA
jgi:hypothetical protein